MGVNFQVECKKSNGNLHLQTRGDFDGSSAWQLINLLHEKDNGKGRIFINTKNLHKICPFGCSTFKDQAKQTRLPVNRLFFKGEKGFEIAPTGSKVIVASKKHKCHCNGNCANCHCSK